MAGKAPYICEPTSASSGRPATFIFLHGYGDDAEGLPLGLAQQFQFHNKMSYLKWLLPNAPYNTDAMTTAWFLPKALPNAMKPRVPGQAEDETAPDDEEGILASVERLDQLVDEEVAMGTDPRRILVGGFSQGCVISLVWGCLGRNKDKVGGVVCLSGYFPLGERIAELRKERGIKADQEHGDGGGKKWFCVHGTKDMLVPTKYFVMGKEELEKWVRKEDVEDHLYDGLTHSTGGPELRHLLIFLERVVPA